VRGFFALDTLLRAVLASNPNSTVIRQHTELLERR
jgi:hypothetical protein